ncbi:MAG: hypothetical protein ACD_39C01049G0001 [uncultured bacterium]|nr:MAG: hypothetical protein ACD_39C01049G0001 [uncultured bacterium]
MLQALSDTTTLRGEKLATDQTFNLKTFEPAALDGCFLFTVTADQTSVFKISGKATVRRSDNLLEFYDAEASFELISGARITILVNGKPLQLERKALSTSSAINDLQPDAVTLTGIDKPLIASTTDETDGIVTNGCAEANLLTRPGELASATGGTAEAGLGSGSWIDPALAPAKNPFADEPLELNGN